MHDTRLFQLDVYINDSLLSELVSAAAESH